MFLDFIRNSRTVESVFIELKGKNNNKPTLIGSIYASPDRNEFKKKIEELKLFVQDFIFSHDILLTGDWNAKIPKNDNSPDYFYQIILDWLQEENSLKIVSTKNPTRRQSNNHLDYLITNVKDKINIFTIKLLQKNSKNHFSDHEALLIEYQCFREKTKYIEPFIRPDYKNYNKKKLCENIKNFKLEEYFNENDTIEKFENDMVDFNGMFNTTFDCKRICIHSKKWWNYSIAKLTNKKNKIRNALNRMKKKNLRNTKKFKEYNLEYIKTRKEITIQRSKACYMKNLMQEQIYRDFGEKEAWNYVKNSFLDPDDQIPTLIKNGKVANTDQEKADLLIQHYASVSNNLPLIDGYGPHYLHVIITNYWEDLRNKQNCNNNRYSNLYNKEQIKDAIIQSNGNASPGMDHIYNRYDSCSKR